MLHHFRLQAIVLWLCLASPLDIASQNEYLSNFDGHLLKNSPHYAALHNITDNTPLSNKNISELTDTIAFDKEKHDYNFVENFAKTHLSYLNHKGYLLARTDSIAITENARILYISRGEQFFYKIKKGNLEELDTGPRKLNLDIFDRPVSFYEFEEATKKILEYLQNIGYPFARIYKTDISIEKPFVHVTLHLDKQYLTTFAAADIPPDVNLSPIFISNLLGVREGMPYEENIVVNSADRLKNLPFVRLNGPVGVRFVQQQAYIVLPLTPVRSNRFDGVAGLAGGDGENLQVSGSFDLFLINSFGHGEFLDVSWQAPGNRTQLLELNGGYPFPAGLPIKPTIDFLLHKQDTTWIRMHYRPAINFNPGNTITFGIFAHIDQNNLLSTKRYRTENTPVRNLDFRKRLYGANFLLMTPGFANDFPQAGSRIELSLSAGHQNILRNYSLPQQIYEGILMKQTLYELQFRMERRLMIAPGIRWEISGMGTLNNSIDLFENQLIRLGGFRTLKGFDEFSILASSYIFGNTELRLYTSDRTFFSGFINGGWYERKQSGGYYNNFALGAGAGLNLETQAGILALYFAIGTQQNAPPQFRNSKIHIGYTTVF